MKEMVYTYPTKTLDTTIDWAAGSPTRSMDIPRDRFIRQIDCRLTVNHTNTVTAPTWLNNAPACLIKELRLIANGNDSRFVMKPVDLYDMNCFDFGIPPRIYNYNTVSSTGNSYVEFSIPFTVEPLNEWDLAELLEAFNFSSLTLYADWGVTGDIASANAPTINSANLQISLRELDLTQEDLDQIGIHMKLRRTYDQVNTLGAAAGLTYVKEIPVGQIMRRIILLVVDNSLKSNSELTEYKVEQASPVQRDIIPKTAWEASRGMDQREYHLPQASLPDGETIIDFETNPLDLRPPIKQGDVKLKATMASPTGTSYVRYIYESVT